tara:strand:+ start:1133 stop:1291 length:159 start_codon:yes stop_codon:yes gene_type:complete
MKAIFNALMKFLRFKNQLAKRGNTFNPLEHSKSENKWLNPKDNFGVLERGKE